MAVLCENCEAYLRDPDYDCFGCTIIHPRRKYPSRTLLHCYADPDLRYGGEFEEENIVYTKHLQSRDITGKTPLMVAAIHGNIDCIKKFIEHGASLHCRDKRGKNAIYLAAQYGRIACYKYLLSIGANGHEKDITGKRGRDNMCHEAILDRLDGYAYDVSVIEEFTRAADEHGVITAGVRIIDNNIYFDDEDPITINGGDEDERDAYRSRYNRHYVPERLFNTMDLIEIIIKRIPIPIPSLQLMCISKCKHTRNVLPKLLRDYADNMHSNEIMQRNKCGLTVWTDDDRLMSLFNKQRYIDKKWNILYHNVFTLTLTPSCLICGKDKCRISAKFLGVDYLKGTPRYLCPAHFERWHHKRMRCYGKGFVFSYEIVFIKRCKRFCIIPLDGDTKLMPYIKRHRPRFKISQLDIDTSPVAPGVDWLTCKQDD